MYVTGTESYPQNPKQQNHHNCWQTVQQIGRFIISKTNVRSTCTCTCQSVFVACFFLTSKYKRSTSTFDNNKYHKIVKRNGLHHIYHLNKSGCAIRSKNHYQQEHYESISRNSKIMSLSSSMPQLAGGFISNETIQSKISITNRQCKIIGTIGPACDSLEQLQLLMDSGINTICIEMSSSSYHHRNASSSTNGNSNNDYSHYTTLIERIRTASENTQRNIAIWIDLMGAEITTGNFIEGMNEIQFKKGNVVVLLTKDTTYLANDSTKLACSYTNLAAVVQPGQQILVADGTLVLTVLGTDITYGEVACRIENTTMLTECRNICIPSLNDNILMNDLPTLSKQDINDIVQFIIPTQQNNNNVCIDYISIGHLGTNGAEDIKNLRQLLTEHNQHHIKIIAKIDTIVALKQLHSIIQVADGIVVNRGELGMNLSTSKVFLAQKYIIHECNIYGKPVCVATQLLNSMLSNPRPTRAECSDIANAVLDGVDCVLLSHETSIGLYGPNAVKVMARTICEAESSRKYNALYTAIRNSVLNRFNNVVSATESLASSAVKTAIDVKAKLIVVLSQSGRTARYIAKYRPGCCIVCLTTSMSVARQTSGMLKGVHTYVVHDFNKDYILAQETGHEAIKVGIAQPNDLMVIVCGNIHIKDDSTGTVSSVVANFANQVRVESITEPPSYDEAGDNKLVLPSDTNPNSPRTNTLSKLQSFRLAYKDDA